MNRLSHVGRCWMPSGSLGLLLVLLLHMGDIGRALSATTLPERWRAVLHEHHQQPASSQGGCGRGARKWSVEEDACLLHQRHGPAAVSWPNVRVLNRSHEACRNRYRDLRQRGVLAACGPWLAAPPSRHHPRRRCHTAAARPNPPTVAAHHGRAACGRAPAW
jgi:hypothetical protein